MNNVTADALNAPSQHPIPDETPDPTTWRLQVDGLVRQPLTLSLSDLSALPRQEHPGSYTCERGWEAGSLRWQGASLAAVLARADPLPEATGLYAHVSGFRSLVPFDAVPVALLADTLDGQALTVERGAPCRLVVHAADCQLSLKWLERLEVVQTSPEEPAGPRRPAS